MELHQTDKSAQSASAYKFLAPINKGLVHEYMNFSKALQRHYVKC
jgi:hypothetical protein